MHDVAACLFCVFSILIIVLGIEEKGCKKIVFFTIAIGTAAARRRTQSQSLQNMTNRRGNEAKDK